MRLQAEVFGGKELLQALKELGDAAGQRGGPVKAAAWAAMEPVLAAAKSNVHVSKGKKKDKGRLMRAIKRQRHSNPRYLNEIVGVGVDPGKTRDDPKGAYYGYIEEFRHPFLRPAMEANRGKSTDIFARKLGAGIEKIAKKIGNKNAQAVGAKVRSRKSSYLDRAVSGPVTKPFSFRGPLKS